MLDEERALWLAGLILETTTYLDTDPGLTVEVEGQDQYWIQIVPETDDSEGYLSGFLLNFPYRDGTSDPTDALPQAGIILPPGTHTVTWEAGGFARLWLRKDVPVVGLAHLAADILHKLMRVHPNAELTVQIEHGF